LLSIKKNEIDLIVNSHNNLSESIKNEIIERTHNNLDELEIIYEMMQICHE